MTQAQSNPKTKRVLFTCLWILLAVFLVFAGIYYYRYTSRYPSTDDAYVRANIVNVAAQISGPVDQIFVKNNQEVKKGQLLFTIDARPFQYAVDQAQAQLALTEQKIAALQAAVKAAQANLQKAQSDYYVAQQNVPRTLALAKEGKVAQAQGIEAQGQLEGAKAAVTAAQEQLQEAISKLGKPGDNNAQIKAAQADLDQAKLNLAHTEIYAPATGYLVNFDLRSGDMVTSGQPLFALVENHEWWVSANYKETDLGRIRPQQKATIKVDIYPHYTFHGYVQSISSGSGEAFALLPPENASGNWVKVTQRFPVKVMIIDPPPQYPLRVGASATVTIDTQSLTP